MTTHDPFGDDPFAQDALSDPEFDSGLRDALQHERHDTSGRPTPPAVPTPPTPAARPRPPAISVTRGRHTLRAELGAWRDGTRTLSAEIRSAGGVTWRLRGFASLDGFSAALARPDADRRAVRSAQGWHTDSPEIRYRARIGESHTRYCSQNMRRPFHDEASYLDALEDVLARQLEDLHPAREMTGEDWLR